MSKECRDLACLLRNEWTQATDSLDDGREPVPLQHYPRGDIQQRWGEKYETLDPIQHSQRNAPAPCFVVAAVNGPRDVANYRKGRRWTQSVTSARPLSPHSTPKFPEPILQGAAKRESGQDQQLWNHGAASIAHARVLSPDPFGKPCSSLLSPGEEEGLRLLNSPRHSPRLPARRHVGIPLQKKQGHSVARGWLA